MIPLLYTQESNSGVNWWALDASPILFSSKFYTTFPKTISNFGEVVQNFKLKKVRDVPKGHQLTPLEPIYNHTMYKFSPSHTGQQNFTLCALEKCLAAATISAAGSYPGLPESAALLAEPKQTNHDATADHIPEVDLIFFFPISLWSATLLYRSRLMRSSVCVALSSLCLWVSRELFSLFRLQALYSNSNRGLHTATASLLTKVETTKMKLVCRAWRSLSLDYRKPGQRSWSVHYAQIFLLARYMRRQQV